MNRETAPEPIRVSVTVLSQMFLYLRSLKVDTDAFLRSLGVDPSIVKSPDGYIPIETYLLIQDEAAVYTNDPYFGLHMGEYAEAGSWSILGYLMMNCKTLGEAVEQITYLLGFSEPSVFRKAFKKWSGVTPREYREQSFSAMSRA